MKVYKISYKAKVEELEFDEVILLPATGKKDAKGRFEGLVASSLGLKGEQKSVPIMYDLSCTEIEITSVQEVE